MKNEKNFFEFRFVKFIINISTALSILFVIYVLYDKYFKKNHFESISSEPAIISDSLVVNNNFIDTSNTESLVDTQFTSSDMSNTGDEIESVETVQLEYFHIQDPDGYTNLRECEDCKIIRKVYPNEIFLKIDSTRKYYVVKFNDGETGYIYKSRVFKSDQ